MDFPRRIIKIAPAYDCLSVQPCTRENDQQACIESSGDFHGRAHAMLMMTLDHKDIEVTLVMNTKWDVPEAPKEVRDNDGPRGAYVMTHSAFPMYADQESHANCCDRWEICYWDFGYTEADEPTRLLITKGSDAVWEWLDTKRASIREAARRAWRDRS